MTPISHTVTAGEGRVLSVLEAGAPDGAPVLMLHGTPGAGLISPELDARARTRGIRLISYARPGYAGSTPHPGRNVADCAADVRAVCTALGVQRVAVWGISGGGPHAAACAGLLEGLVAAVGVLGSIAPYGAPKLDYFDGMGQDNIDEIRGFLTDPAAARATGREQREGLLGMTPEQMREMWSTLFSPVDAAMLTPEFGAAMLGDMQAGLAPGDEGWWDDNGAHLGDWGFGLTQIRIPVLVVHGGEDQFVPVAHGRWLADAIPGAEARILPAEGHVSLLGAPLDDVHAWLLERLG